MNKRARLARQILRDHQRQDYLYLHVRRDFTQPALDVYSFWACPRCLGWRTTVALPGATFSLDAADLTTWTILRDELLDDQHRVTPVTAEQPSWHATIGTISPGRADLFLTETVVKADTEEEAKQAAREWYEIPDDPDTWVDMIDSIEVERLP